MNVVIIGASKGLGRALVAKFAEQGHNVIAGVRVPMESEDAADFSLPNIRIMPMDVTNDTSIREAVNRIARSWGHVDVVINCAGVLMKGDQEDTIFQSDLHELRWTLEVNVVGTVIVMQHFLPLMGNHGRGIMMMITSEAGCASSSGNIFPAYSISKAAANKAVYIGRATAGDRCRMYAVHPGRMNTEMGRRFAQIEPEHSADSIYQLVVGEKPIQDNGYGFINYKGEAMPL